MHCKSDIKHPNATSIPAKIETARTGIRQLSEEALEELHLRASKQFARELAPVLYVHHLLDVDSLCDDSYDVIIDEEDIDAISKALQDHIYILDLLKLITKECLTDKSKEQN